MDGLALAPMLVLGSRSVVVEKRHGPGVDWHGTDVPEQDRDRGEHNRPSNDGREARDHPAQGTGAPPALSTPAA